MLLIIPALCFGQNDPGAYEVTVRFTSFSATAKSRNLVVLNWVTETEVVHKTFEIQRSLNGIDFDPLGSVPSLDTYSGPKSYNFQDNGLSFVTTDRLLYRIRQISPDGISGFSKIIVVDRGPGNPKLSVMIIPNPVEEELKVNIQNSNSPSLGIRLFNAEGREVYSRLTNITQAGIIVIPVSQLRMHTAGIYFAKVFFQDGTSASIKFLKK
jgi:hypothetical protein